MAIRIPKPDQQMCVATIDFQDFILSPEQGMQLVKIMQNAIVCEERFGGIERSYVRGHRPRLEVKIINQSQIRTAAEALDTE